MTVAAFLVLGLSLLHVVVVLIFPDFFGADRLDALLMMVVLLFPLGGLTYWWLRHRHYGVSICRLITLPGVIGGWFKADVECRLPLDDIEPVQVILGNVTWKGEYLTGLWETQCSVQPGELRKGPRKRVIVPVRIAIPRHPAQESSFRPPASSIAASPVKWILEIRRRSPGVDFLATFPDVPVFDTTEAPPEEQLPE